MIELPKDSEYIAATQAGHAPPTIHAGVTHRLNNTLRAPDRLVSQDPCAAAQLYCAPQISLRPLSQPHAPPAFLAAPQAGASISVSNKKAAQSAYIAALRAPFVDAVKNGFRFLWEEIGHENASLRTDRQGLRGSSLPLDPKVQPQDGPEEHLGVQDLDALVLKSLFFSRSQLTGDELFATIKLIVDVFPAGKGPTKKFVPKLLQWLSFEGDKLNLLQAIKSINRHMDALGVARSLLEDFCISITEVCDLVGYRAVTGFLEDFMQLIIKQRRQQPGLQIKIFETFAVHRRRCLKERWVLLINLHLLSARYPDGAMTLELADQLATLCLRSCGSSGGLQNTDVQDLQVLQELSDPSRDKFAHEALWFTLKYSFGSSELSCWRSCASFIVKQKYLKKADLCEDVAGIYVTQRIKSPQRMRLSELLLILYDESRRSA